MVAEPVVTVGVFVKAVPLLVGEAVFLQIEPLEEHESVDYQYGNQHDDDTKDYPRGAGPSGVHGPLLMKNAINSNIYDSIKINIYQAHDQS